MADPIIPRIPPPEVQIDFSVEREDASSADESLALAAAGIVSHLSSDETLAHRSITKLREIDLNALPPPLGRGFGYKTSNLINLSEIAKENGCEVPAFIPLSHTECLEHIRKTYPTIYEDYSEFLSLLGNPPILSESCKAILYKIREGIFHAFNNEGNLFKLEKCKLETLHSEYIAIRSTGKEDSTTNSNAGGNFSNPFVRKDERSISRNIGEVIASYFSERSISQRIASKDASLIEDREPFMPVLIQTAVYEPIEGDTPPELQPRSAVLFVGKAMSELSMGLGHNKGVVEASIAADAIIMPRFGRISYSVEVKKSRFRAIVDKDGSIACVEVPCDKKTAEAPALSDGMLSRLRGIANAIFDYYQMEMDVELTIIGDVIYLLQARPLITPKSDPSYLELNDDVIVGSALTVGGSSVQEISSKENIIICNTINEAYREYKKRDAEGQSELVKGIIIRRGAPRTSHYAVFFRGRGLPIIIANQKIEFGYPYFIDPQQGVIAQDGRKKEGYICYPIPLKYSMQTNEVIKASAVQAVKICKDAPKKSSILSVQDIRDRLNLIKFGSLEDANRASFDLIHFVYSLSKKRGITPFSRTELVMILGNLMYIATDDRIEPLYKARLIEACFFQTGEGIVGGFSVIRSLGAIRDQTLGALGLGFDPSKEKEAHLEDILFVKVGRQFLQEDLQIQWASMLDALIEVPFEEKEKVKDLLLQIDAINGLTEFVNVVLVRILNDSGSISEVVAKLVTLKKDMLPVLNKVREIQQFVGEIRGSLQAWSTSEHIRKRLPWLQQRLLDLDLTLEEGCVYSMIQSASPEAKLIYVQAIREAVGAYDDLIKQCTGSENYLNYMDQATDFFALLHPYRKLMKALSATPYDSRSYSLILPSGELTEAKAKGLMEISPGFDVALLINPWNNTDVQPAETFEEKFTLFHQTMMESLSKLSLESGLSDGVLPKQFLEFMSGIKNGYFNKKQLIGIHINGSYIIAEYNIKLCFHGCRLTLNYDSKKEVMDITISMYGPREIRGKIERWKLIHETFEPVLKYLDISVRELRYGEHGIDIAFAIPLNGGEERKVNGQKLVGEYLRAGGTGVFSLLELMPPECQTLELVKKEMDRFPLLCRFVRPDLLTDEVAEMILQQESGLSIYLPVQYQTPERVIIAVKRNGLFLQFVHPSCRTPEVIDAAIKQNPSAAKFLVENESD